MIVHFVDIGGIVDHHCLNFLFIMTIWNVIIIPHIKDVEGGGVDEIEGPKQKVMSPTSAFFAISQHM